MTSGLLAAPRCVMLRLVRGSARRRSTSAMSGVHALGRADFRLDAPYALGEPQVLEIGEGGAGRGGIERAVAVMRHRADARGAADGAPGVRRIEDELGNGLKRVHLAGRHIE